MASVSWQTTDITLTRLLLINSSSICKSDLTFLMKIQMFQNSPKMAMKLLRVIKIWTDCLCYHVQTAQTQDLAQIKSKFRTSKFVVLRTRNSDEWFKAGSATVVWRFKKDQDSGDAVIHVFIPFKCIIKQLYLDHLFILHVAFKGAN